MFAESPLHYWLGVGAGHPGGASSDPAPGVLIRESPSKGYLNLRGDPADGSFRKDVADVLGVALPNAPNSYGSDGAKSIYWLGPDEWLAVIPGGEEAQTERRLRMALRGHFSIVDVSGGQTLVNLSGPGALAVLRKSSTYDFHPASFAPGRCVQTTFAKATALIAKQADGSYDLIFRRSFADYLAAWLLDAAAEFGCRIQGHP